MRRFAILALAAALAAPLVGRAEKPTRLVLPDSALTGVVGGLGAAVINLALPQDLVTSPQYSINPSVSWNRNGGRCLFSCTSGTHPGAASQGFDASSPLILQLAGFGLPTPVFEVSGDGKLRARAAALLLASTGGYDLFRASLQTKCVGGPNAGILCNGTNICGSGNSGGECLVTDHNGAHNTAATADGPCGFSICAGGTSAGMVCNVATDCPIAGGGFAACSAVTLQSPARTCYSLANCGVGGLCTDCRTTGAGLTSTATGTAKNVHAVRARALSPAAGQPGTTLSQIDTTYQWTLGDSSDPGLLCSGNCAGVTDTCVIVPPDPICKSQPTTCG